jgi:hypothetical protein
MARRSSVVVWRCGALHLHEPFVGCGYTPFNSKSFTARQGLFPPCHENIENVKQVPSDIDIPLITSEMECNQDLVGQMLHVLEHWGSRHMPVRTRETPSRSSLLQTTSEHLPENHARQAHLHGGAPVRDGVSHRRRSWAKNHSQPTDISSKRVNRWLTTSNDDGVYSKKGRRAPFQDTPA